MLNIYVLHYADDETTRRCIESLLDDEWIWEHCQIFVIDNGSPVPFNDSGITSIRTAQPIQVIRHVKNYHLIPAFAYAMRRYPAVVYGLLNNDVLVTPGAVRTIIEIFDDPNVGIVAPGSSDGGAGILYVPGPGQWGNVETSQVDNHCIWLNHAMIEEIGYPETDGHPHRASWAWNKYYCWKARKAEWKVVAARNAYVQHLHRGGYDAEADIAGREWLVQRLGQQFAEAW